MEEWLDIKGYEGLYKISSSGKVKSYHPFGNHQKIGKEHYIAPTFTSTGYYKVELMKNHIRRSFKIHRLVAIAFIPNPLNKPYVNHLDGNKLNNHVSNLEWCTQKENITHAYETGLIPKNEVTKEEFVELYVNQHKGIVRIATEKHISLARAKRYLHQYGIKEHIGVKYDVPLDELKNDFKKGKRNIELSKKYKCSPALIATRKTQFKKGLI